MPEVDMARELQEPGESGVCPEIYETLASATPAERREIVLHLLEAHPQGRLVLPMRDGMPAILTEVDLSRAILQARCAGTVQPPRWWNPEFPGLNLRHADLRGANLRRVHLQGADLCNADLQDALLGAANLQGAILEEANLQRADLVGSNLQEARLGEARLQGAMIEDANAQRAVLRFAYLQHAVLEAANLQDADLWGANLEAAELAYANLQGAILEEANLQRANLTGVNLQGAVLRRANLQGARLRRANLQGAVLENANLQGAVLSEARLQGVVLSRCNITHAHFSGAWLERTQLQQKQLGGALGEELEGAYEAASQAYLALEQNFLHIGDLSASSWAYRKRRRMQKLEARKQAGRACAEGSWWMACTYYATYVSDQFVELLCDYGESIRRVCASILVVYLLFTLIYGLTSSVVRLEETPAGVMKVPTSNVVDLLTFSLLAMSTSGSPVVGLLPRSQAVHLLTASEALLGIALTGLLGFVVGNRIRR